MRQKEGDYKRRILFIVYKMAEIKIKIKLSNGSTFDVTIALSATI